MNVVKAKRKKHFAYSQSFFFIRSQGQTNITVKEKEWKKHTPLAKESNELPHLRLPTYLTA